VPPHAALAARWNIAEVAPPPLAGTKTKIVTNTT